MRKLILAAGVAALAITAPASAKPDKAAVEPGGQAQAKAAGGGQKAQRGGGGGQKAERRGGGGGQQAQRVERRGGGGERRAAQMERRGGASGQRMERRGGGERQAQRIERRRPRSVEAQRVDRRGWRRAPLRQLPVRPQRAEGAAAGREAVVAAIAISLVIEDRGRGGERHEIRNREQRFASHEQFRGRNDARVRNFGGRAPLRRARSR